MTTWSQTDFPFISTYIQLKNLTNRVQIQSPVVPCPLNYTGFQNFKPQFLEITFFGHRTIVLWNDTIFSQLFLFLFISPLFGLVCKLSIENAHKICWPFMDISFYWCVLSWRFGEKTTFPHFIFINKVVCWARHLHVVTTMNFHLYSPLYKFNKQTLPPTF